MPMFPDAHISSLGYLCKNKETKTKTTKMTRTFVLTHKFSNILGTQTPSKYKQIAEISVKVKMLVLIRVEGPANF